MKKMLVCWFLYKHLKCILNLIYIQLESKISVNTL